MNLRDYIGRRGENIFRVLISKWCDGKPWFHEVPLGEKHEALDFAIGLADTSYRGAFFYVQVKATQGKYVGRGRNRKLCVKVSAADIEKLKDCKGPAFVVGIDINSDRRGYIAEITASSRSMASLSLRHPLNCRTIKALWKQVDEYWKMRDMRPTQSQFSS